MSIDARRRRTQEILDSVPRAVQRSHPEHEDTDPPPPIPTPWPTSEGRGSPSATIQDPPPHVKRLGNWGKYIAGIVAGATALYTVGAPVVAWIGTRPSDQDLRDARTYCATVAASAAASAVAPYQPRMDAAEAKIKRDGQRWDALDKFHRQHFQRRNAPPICQFGPKAESRGNACTVEDLDTP
jgi:hypothetical protein